MQPPDEGLRLLTYTCRFRPLMKSMKNVPFSTAIRSTSDLAKKLGLSRWTISRVINGHDGISPETVLRVREAMSEVGFSPNSLARGLRKGTTNIIGICIPEIEGLYLSQKLEFLRRALADEGQHVMVGITNGDRQEEAETLNRFCTLRAAGVILFASQLSANSPPVRQFRTTGIPLIFVDPLTRPPKGSLYVDRAAGMRDAVRHLFELGHRHIATLGFEPENRYSQTRLKGIMAAYEERGLDHDKFVWQVELVDPDGSYYEQGRNSAALLCREWGGENRNVRPTAVLTLNDRVAIGLMDGFRELGIRVPEDISVIGYDNMEVGAFVSPQLTTIDAKPDELIRKATESLLAHIRGNHEAEPISICPRLLIRASTGAAPKTQRIK